MQLGLQSVILKIQTLMAHKLGIAQGVPFINRMMELGFRPHKPCDYPGCLSVVLDSDLLETWVAAKRIHNAFISHLHLNTFQQTSTSLCSQGG